MSELQLDWTKVLHTHENNSVSQGVLEENRYHFTGQCAVVYSLLTRGLKLDTSSALLRLKIGHLPRRIGDLRAKGVPIVSEPVIRNGKKTRYVKYFLKPE